MCLFINMLWGFLFFWWISNIFNLILRSIKIAKNHIKPDVENIFFYFPQVPNQCCFSSTAIENCFNFAPSFLSKHKKLYYIYFYVISSNQKFVLNYLAISNLFIAHVLNISIPYNSKFNTFMNKLRNFSKI